jgi:hypothetical protein
MWQIKRILYKGEKDMDENLSNVVKYLNECVMYLNDDRVSIDDKNEFLTANNGEITNDMEYLMKISGNPKSAEEKEVADKCYNSLLAALQRLKEITAKSASVEQEESEVKKEEAEPVKEADKPKDKPKEQKTKRKPAQQKKVSTTSPIHYNYMIVYDNIQFVPFFAETKEEANAKLFEASRNMPNSDIKIYKITVKEIPTETKTIRYIK